VCKAQDKHIPHDGQSASVSAVADVINDVVTPVDAETQRIAMICLRRVHEKNQNTTTCVQFAGEMFVKRYYVCGVIQY